MTSREYLDMHHIQWTQERLQVVEYLMEHHTHPTADEVYQRMREEGKDVSRATVFNTLNTLSEKGAITALQIEDGVTRFDIELHSHAHFRCEKCGKIFNIAMKRNASFEIPENFHPSYKNYYIIGCCPDCYDKSRD